MSPILGIWASAQQGTSLPNSYESIATVNVTSSQSTVTFSSIPSTYKHLQIRALATSSGNDNGLYMRLNSDSSNSYKNHQIYGQGTSAVANADPTGTSLRSNVYVATNLFPTNFAGMITDILDYSNTNKNKTIRSFNGNDRNGAGFISLFSALWINTNAINAISFTTDSNIVQYSSFALYGIKG